MSINWKKIDAFIDNVLLAIYSFYFIFYIFLSLFLSFLTDDNNNERLVSTVFLNFSLRDEAERLISTVFLNLSFRDEVERLVSTIFLSFSLRAETVSLEIDRATTIVFVEWLTSYFFINFMLLLNAKKLFHSSYFDLYFNQCIMYWITVVLSNFRMQRFCYEISSSSKTVASRNKNSYLNSLTNNVILYLF